MGWGCCRCSSQVGSSEVGYRNWKKQILVGMGLCWWRSTNEYLPWENWHPRYFLLSKLFPEPPLLRMLSPTRAMDMLLWKGKLEWTSRYQSLWALIWSYCLKSSIDMNLERGRCCFLKFYNQAQFWVLIKTQFRVLIKTLGKTWRGVAFHVAAVDTWLDWGRLSLVIGKNSYRCWDACYILWSLKTYIPVSYLITFI